MIRTGKHTPIYKKERKEDPGKYKLESLTSLPGKIMKQIVLEDILGHIRDEQMI